MTTTENKPPMASNASEDERVVEARDACINAMISDPDCPCTIDEVYSPDLYREGVRDGLIAAEPRLVFVVDEFCATQWVTRHEDREYCYWLRTDGRIGCDVDSEGNGYADVCEAIYACNVHNLVQRYTAIANGENTTTDERSGT